MDRLDCTVRIGGDLNVERQKFNITVAEAALLQLIHGQDSVVHVKPREATKDKLPEVLSDLSHRYKKHFPRLKAAYHGRVPSKMADIQTAGVEEPEAVAA